MKNIFKSKLQLIPITVVFVFVLTLIYSKFGSNYSAALLGGSIANLLAWVSFVSISLLFLALVISIIMMIIKKDGNHDTVRKISIVFLEMILIGALMIGMNNSVRAFMQPSATQRMLQVNNSISNNNKLIVGQDVSQDEIKAVHSLFKDGDPAQKENKVLKILKLDGACKISDSDKVKYHYYGTFNNCSAGDIYVEYGWDVCVSECDTVGYRSFEYYRVNKVDGNWTIAEKYSSPFVQ